MQAIKKFMLIGQHYKIYPSICAVKRQKSDSSYLSFAGDGLSIAWTFSLNGITPKQRDEYCRKLTDIALAYNGRTYLAKHPYFAKDDFHGMYPDYKIVLEMKKKHDPDCLFLSRATQRLLL
mgnify:CR=1 FL=1